RKGGRRSASRKARRSEIPRGAKRLWLHTWGGSALHHVDVFDRDRSAVAIIANEDGKTDRRLGSRHGQNKERENLAGEIAEKGRKSNQIDIDRKQDQLDRHQDDNDIPAVEHDARHAEREQDGGDNQKLRKRDRQHDFLSGAACARKLVMSGFKCRASRRPCGSRPPRLVSARSGSRCFAASPRPCAARSRRWRRSSRSTE